MNHYPKKIVIISTTVTYQLCKLEFIWETKVVNTPQISTWIEYSYFSESSVELPPGNLFDPYPQTIEK